MATERTVLIELYQAADTLEDDDEEQDEQQEEHDDDEEDLW